MFYLVSCGFRIWLSLSIQLVDDILDYEAGDATLGKPGGADLQLGLATGPALFAWEEHPEMGPLIKRKFSKPGDVEVVGAILRDRCVPNVQPSLFPSPSGTRSRPQIIWRREDAGACTSACR